MEKVLPGTTNAVLAFIRQRWADLLQVTLLPVAIVVAAGVVQYLAMRPLFASLFDMAAGGRIGPEIVGRLMQFYGFLALGRSPDFFHEMWALSKGESWGVPLRLIFGMLVLIAIAIPVLVLAIWPMISDISELAKTAEGGSIPPEVFQTLMSRMVPVQVVMVIVQIPTIWYSVLLFAEAYRRFTAQRRP